MPRRILVSMVGVCALWTAMLIQQQEKSYRVASASSRATSLLVEAFVVGGRACHHHGICRDHHQQQQQQQRKNHRPNWASSSSSSWELPLSSQSPLSLLYHQPRQTSRRHSISHSSNRYTTRLYAAQEAIDLPELATMKAGQMRQELESYGISTKSFLEKNELLQALEQARAQGKKPINGSSSTSSSGSSSTTTTTEDENNNNNASSSPETTTTTSTTTTQSKEFPSSSPSSSSSSRQERLEAEMAKAKQMSVGELRKELGNRGIPFQSFFEKSEFVKAYAEAVVDGTTKKRPSTTTPKNNPKKEEEEVYDPSYRDVTVQKMGREGQQRLLTGGSVIDISLKRKTGKK